MLSFLTREKLRFVMAGFFNTTLDFVLLNVLAGIVGLGPLAANTISVMVGITTSYVLNHKFVFRFMSPFSLRKYIHFFAVTGFSSLIIQNSIIYGFAMLTHSKFGRALFIIRQLGEHQQVELNIAKVMAVGVGLVWNFVLYKYVVFKPERKHNL